MDPYVTVPHCLSPDFFKRRNNNVADMSFLTHFFKVRLVGFVEFFFTSFITTEFEIC